MKEAMNEQAPALKSNLFLGTIGAIVGALIGSLLWVVIYQLGYVASIAGIVVFIAAHKGYTLLSKRKDLPAAVIATVVSLAVLVMVHLFCLGLALYNEMGAMYELTLWDSIRAAPKMVFNPKIIAEDSEILLSFITDLGMGLVMICLAAFPAIRQAIRDRQSRNAAGVETYYSNLTK